MKKLFALLVLNASLCHAEMTKYTFSITSDTSNGIVNPRVLQDEIISSAITTTPVYINTASDGIDIFMSSQLTGARATTLTNVVADHKGGMRKTTLITIYGTAGASIPKDETTLIDWGTSPGEVFDSGGEFTTNTFIPNRSRRYTHKIQNRVNALASGELITLSIVTNGVEAISHIAPGASGTGAIYPSFSTTLYHEKGDSVRAFVKHSDSVSRSLNAGGTYSFWIITVE